MRDIVPQADSVSRILRFPDKVAEGRDTNPVWAEEEDVEIRQAGYYGEAAEALGLVNAEGSSFSLTWGGMMFRTLSEEGQRGFLVSKMLHMPIIQRVLNHPDAREEPGISIQQIEGIIRENYDLSGSTVSRRAKTVVNWLAWIGKQTGVIKRFDRQLLVQL